MDVTAVINYVTSDAGMATIFGVAFGIMAVAQIIVNLTPTPKDDEFVGKAYKWLERVAGIWSYKAKMLPGESLVEKQPKPAEVK
ncbi:MAG: hypothetical protein A4E20_01425 [Nitrospira sp. SG-bin2]|uniref:hypothetical protein n=1 Tax=Nitrospira cf. moscoviensis SBR1015 TaxID=96242 RepID=UPI000A0BA185|nr:hypothetical protein [Nitrospira cf. moscoviensis SBR1015]OQW34865.1 MAG: hypothetical protein A4E20_01425 [Nitrospira sp. SG-bin2]